MELFCDGQISRALASATASPYPQHFIKGSLTIPQSQQRLQTIHYNSAINETTSPNTQIILASWRSGLAHSSKSFELSSHRRASQLSQWASAPPPSGRTFWQNHLQSLRKLLLNIADLRSKIEVCSPNLEGWELWARMISRLLVAVEDDGHICLIDNNSMLAHHQAGDKIKLRSGTRNLHF